MSLPLRFALRELRGGVRGLRIVIAWRGEIDEGEVPLFAVEPFDLFQSQKVEKGDRLFDVTDADHAMQEFGQVFLHSSP